MRQRRLGGEVGGAEGAGRSRRRERDSGSRARGGKIARLAEKNIYKIFTQIYKGFCRQFCIKMIVL